MVVAQYTGIGLQKDDKAFLKYNPDTDTYDSYPNVKNLHSDKDAVFKPSYENYHIKASNDAYIQCVSVFAIGFANQFDTDDGGDISVTNSNSNFGSRSLIARGFKKAAFSQDDVGFITHVIPPKQIEPNEVNIEFLSLDVSKTVSIGNSTRVYLSGYKNQSIPPIDVIDGYRVGAKRGEILTLPTYIAGVSNQYTGLIVMPNSGQTSETVSYVGRNVIGISSITSNTIKFKESHSFVEGESVRLISENAFLPKNITNNQTYYAITNGLLSDEIKLAKTYQDSLGANNVPIEINNLGGELKVVSRVSDKLPGDPGHPIQWDSTNSQWYITLNNGNSIYPAIVANAVALGANTSRTFIKRKPSKRTLEDSIYQLRYVIPKEYTVARPPIDGFVIQESASVDSGTDSTLIYDGTTISASTATTQLKNPHFISTASWSTNIVTVTTEKPHKLVTGSIVNIKNIRSTNNTSGTFNSGYNGTFIVTSTPTTKTFTYTLTTNPGTVTNDSNTRGSNFAYFERNKYKNSYYVYRTKEVQSHIANYQDGIYHLICLNVSNVPSDVNFNDLSFSQNVRYLYPQYDRDNPESDPTDAISYASNKTIGKVDVDDVRKSITRKTVNQFFSDSRVSIGITDIVSSGVAHTVFFDQEHGFSGITSVSITSAGAGYGVTTSFNGILYNATLSGGSGSNATANVTISSGAVSAVTIVDPGSAYVVGDTLTVVGVGTTTGYAAASLTVTNINNSINEVIRVSGISSIAYSSYNDYYRITSVNSAKSVIVESSSSFSSNTGIGSTVTSNSVASVLGKAVQLDSALFTYDRVSGIATATTTSLAPHGLIAGNSVKIVGAGQSQFNGVFSVVSTVGLNTFTADVGIGTTSLTMTGTVYAYPTGYSAQGGELNEKVPTFFGRASTIYAGITTTLSTAITSLTSTAISITNVGTTGLKKGDYIVVDTEIMRIRDSALTVVSRGLLGTRASTHLSGAIVRKITIIPTEFRRNSIIRASNHAFEYTGYGPGNYSTGLPSEQIKILSKEEQLLSQSTKVAGGIVVYTGMNANGDFYIGNKKVSSATGQEEVFDSPIPTFTGEDISDTGVNIGFDVLSPLEVTVTRSIRVDGGENKNIISKFDGPVIFNKKITSYASEGIEATSLFLQGNADVSKKISVSVDTPTEPGGYGDKVFNANPESGGFEGWVYTTNNRWEKYGIIGNNNAPGIATNTFVVNEDNSSTVRYPIFSRVSAGTTNTLLVDTASIVYTPSTGILSATGYEATNYIGIGTTAPTTIIPGNITNDGVINNYGEIRIYRNQPVRFLDSTTTNTVSVVGPSSVVGFAITFTLPNSTGSNGQVLKTDGSGRLSWVSVGVVTTTDNLPEGSSNLYFTNERAQDAVGSAISSGIQTGISVTYDDSNNRINFNIEVPPFYTPGFSVPL
jgi:hypothetical protein